MIAAAVAVQLVELLSMKAHHVPAAIALPCIREARGAVDTLAGALNSAATAAVAAIRAPLLSSTPVATPQSKTAVASCESPVSQFSVSTGAFSLEKKRLIKARLNRASTAMRALLECRHDVNAQQRGLSLESVVATAWPSAFQESQECHKELRAIVRSACYRMHANHGKKESYSKLVMWARSEDDVVQLVDGSMPPKLLFASDGVADAFWRCLEALCNEVEHASPTAYSIQRLLGGRQRQ